MKKIKTILIIFTLIMFCQIEPLYVNAQTFLTDSNIELTEEEYNYLLQFYPESIIAKMDEEKLNYELSHDFKLLGNETKYITTHTHYVGNIPTEVIEENIQEKEYNNLVTPYTACNFGNDCWETTSKKVSLSVYTPSSNVYRIYMSNEWKNIPSVKSFDVLATAVDGINFTNGMAWQTYNGTNLEYDIHHGTNTKRTSGFIGVSMNIPDNVNSNNALMQTILIDGGFNVCGNVTARGTYQHAKRDVTLAQSQNYSYSTSGLGGMLAFKNGVGNYYDGMQGVSYKFNVS